MLLHPAQEVAVQQENRRHLLRALRKLGIHFITVRYAASCSRQALCRIQAQPKQAVACLVITPVIQCWAVKRRKSPTAPATASCLMTLEAALQAFTLHWVSLRHGRWNHDEGGSGELTIDVATGHFTLTHETFFIEKFRYQLTE